MHAWSQFDKPTVIERSRDGSGFDRDARWHTVAEWPRQDAVLVFADGTALHVRNVRAVVDVAERFPIGADLWVGDGWQIVGRPGGFDTIADAIEHLRDDDRL